MRHRRFLEYVVDRVLAGEENQIKEATLAQEVFDRPGTYDPKIDTVVRVEARRLRAKLQEYYSGAGAAEPIRFVLPKGTYVVNFESSANQISKISRSGKRFLTAAIVVALAILVIGFNRARVVAHANDALANGKRNSERYLNLKKAEHFDAAERLLREAVSELPRSAEALSELGLLYGRRYQITGQGVWRDKAQEIFQSAVAIDPCHATSNALLSSIAREYGDFDRAVEIGRRAVACSDASAQAHNALGLTWLYMGFYEAAEAEFRAAAQRDSTFLSAPINLSESLLYQSRIDEARLAAQKALTIEPLSPIALLAAGDTEMAAGNRAAAAVLWDKIMNVAPEEMAPLRAVLSGLKQVADGDPRTGLEAVSKYRQARETGGLLWAHEYVRLCVAVEEFAIAQECMKSDPHMQEYRGLLSTPELQRFRGQSAFTTLLEQKYDRWQRELKKYGAGLSPAPPVLPAPEQFLRVGRF
jgi:tetratricopeptide (TPR) repeat protein